MATEGAVLDIIINPGVSMEPGLPLQAAVMPLVAISWNW